MDPHQRRVRRRDRFRRHRPRSGAPHTPPPGLRRRRPPAHQRRRIPGDGQTGLISRSSSVMTWESARRQSGPVGSVRRDHLFPSANSHGWSALHGQFECGWSTHLSARRVAAVRCCREARTPGSRPGTAGDRTGALSSRSLSPPAVASQASLADFPVSAAVRRTEPRHALACGAGRRRDVRVTGACWPDGAASRAQRGT